MNPVLTLDHVSYSYHTPSGETPALKDVSFSVRPGSFTSIAGPSGCGKSTLLSLIAGLIAPEKGCIRFYKSDAMPAAARIGYMLQHDTLLEWRTIYKNILLGLEVTHQCTEQKKRLAADMMHDYGLASFKNAHPSELSGGMRQRAALIRTLVLEPDILLFAGAAASGRTFFRIGLSDKAGSKRRYFPHYQGAGKNGTFSHA